MEKPRGRAVNVYNVCANALYLKDAYFGEAFTIWDFEVNGVVAYRAQKATAVAHQVSLQVSFLESTLTPHPCHLYKRAATRKHDTSSNSFEFMFFR